jgi:hypothetical protein
MRCARLSARCCKTETFAEEPDVLAVVGVQFVAEMAAELHLRRQAADALPGDFPHAGEPLRWITERGAIRLLLGAAALAIEVHRVYVNPPILGIPEDTPRR